MNYESIQYNVSDQILTMVLNRPDRLNAVNDKMKASGDMPDFYPWWKDRFVFNRREIFEAEGKRKDELSIVELGNISKRKRGKA